MSRNDITIRGDRPLYGSVEIMGDPYSAIHLICIVILLQKRTTITNIPRSPILLNFLSLISSLNIDYEWTNETSLFFKQKNTISRDVVIGLQGEQYNDYYGLLIPIILSLYGQCSLSPEVREEARFYRRIGYPVIEEKTILKISSPIGDSLNVNIDVSDFDLYGLMSKHLLSLSNKNITVTNWKNNIYSSYIQWDFSNQSESEMTNRYNRRQFSLYASMSLFASGELIVKGFALDEYLPVLLKLGELGLAYEVIGDELKLWGELVNIEKVYQLNNVSVDLVALIIIILTLLSKKSVQIPVSKNSINEKMIMDMNIMGAKLNLEKNPESDFEVINLRPSSISPAKNVEINSTWGGALILAAVLSGGVNRFFGIETIIKEAPNLLDNLENLNIDFKVG